MKGTPIDEAYFFVFSNAIVCYTEIIYSSFYLKCIIIELLVDSTYPLNLKG